MTARSGSGIASFRSTSPGLEPRPDELLVWISLGANLPLPEQDRSRSSDNPGPGFHSPPSASPAAGPVAGALPGQLAGALPGQAPMHTLIWALHALHAVCPVIAVSSLWRTQPVDQESGQIAGQVHHSDFQQLSACDAEGEATQPPMLDFVNACALIRTTLPVEQVLALTQQIELRFGRVRDPLYPKGPRTLDLDLLLAVARGRSGAATPVLRDTSSLTSSLGASLSLPHPSMHRRRFVLAPLDEIAPTLQHPHREQSVSQMLTVLGPVTAFDAVTRLDPPEWPALCAGVSRDREPQYR
jgi:2-amino-4-hydroxy-6-hydroxymethyldihydropteridine diphosphokinase